ncbi:MAG: hypothetical protein ACYTGX_05495 [Planctomycetota bacterium]|jgi:hypothetical protein
MKKILGFLFLVGAAAGIFFAVTMGETAKYKALVDDLAKFKVPEDPYNAPITEKLKTNSGKIIERTRVTRWTYDHDDDRVVRDCWARRKEGTIPLVIEMVKDTAKPANQRIAGLLVLGFSNTALKEDRAAIVPALAEQLSNTGDRIAEFAAFALGEFRKEAVDEAAADVYAKAKKTDVKYYALVALRDARVMRNPNDRFDKVATAPLVDALKTGDKQLRVLVAKEARHLNGLDFDGYNLLDGLMGMICDADADIAGAAVYSLRYKVSELDQTSPDLKARADGVVTKAKELYGKGGPDHARANAVSAVTFVNDERANVTMGLEIAVDTELYTLAREQDKDNALVMGAVAEGLGKHGSLEDRLQMVNLLLADCAPELAKGVGIGLSKCKEKWKDTKINDKAVEALKSAQPHCVQAAAAIVGHQGTELAAGKKGMIASLEGLAAALDAAKDDATKDAILAAAKLIIGKPVKSSKAILKYAK